MKSILIISVVYFICCEGSAISNSLGFQQLVQLNPEPFDVPASNNSNEGIARNSRIVFGSTAAAGQFPHYALIFIRRSTATVQCGAGLIAKSWVLTADHCVRDALSIELRFGVTHRDKFEQRIYASGLARLTANDIALIKLTSDIQETNSVKPAFLPRSAERSQLYAKKKAVVCGMGIENQKTSAVSSYLKYAELEVMSQSDCAVYYGPVDMTRLCAKSPSSYASTCPGDSGSPLNVKEDDSYVIVGVVSFGAAAGCDLGYPVGYCRTTAVLDWIVYYTGINLRP